MKKNITYYGLVFLLLINIFLVSLIFMKNRDISLLNIKISEFEATDKYTSLKIEHCLKVVKLMQKANQISLPPELTLQNENGNNVHLSNLVGKKPKLVFRYTQLNCNICIDSQMGFIKEFVNKYGYDKLIMISNYKYKKNIYQFKTLNNINNEIFNVEILDSALDRLNIPYYFILNKVCQPTIFHFPDKNFPENTKEYFKSIEDQYFNDL